MAKNRLVFDPDYDFELYGIITSIKEYKLAWELNKRLEIHLVKQPDIELEFIKEGPLIFSNYRYEKDRCIYKLVRNKSADQSDNKVRYLLPELQKFDYFLQIHSQFTDINVITSTIKSISLVDFVSHFKVSGIKSKANLIF